MRVELADTRKGSHPWMVIITSSKGVSASCNHESRKAAEAWVDEVFGSSSPYRQPSIKTVAGCVKYLKESLGVEVKGSLIRESVNAGKLPAYRIGSAFHFAPLDVDDWIKSLRTT